MTRMSRRAEIRASLGLTAVGMLARNTTQRRMPAGYGGLPHEARDLRPAPLTTVRIVSRRHH
jgi:hypothetical protein